MSDREGFSPDFDVVSGPSEQDPVAAIAAQVAALREQQAAEADKPFTIADIAAAAITALETLVAVMPSPQKEQIIAQFEERAAAFAASMEVEK